MQRRPIRSSVPHSIRALASRVGHDAVWLAIAGLFCIVEGAVKVTELSPTKLLRRRRGDTDDEHTHAHGSAYAR